MRDVTDFVHLVRVDLEHGAIAKSEGAYFMSECEFDKLLKALNASGRSRTCRKCGGTFFYKNDSDKVCKACKSTRRVRL